MQREAFQWLRARILAVHGEPSSYPEYLRLMDTAFKHCGDRQYALLEQEITDRETLGEWDAETGRYLGAGQALGEPRPGYVYVLKAENDLYKIGRAKVLDARVTQIGVQVPFQIELWHSIRCSDHVKSESLIHARFRGQRVKGEWFRLSESDLEWLLRCPGW